MAVLDKKISAFTTASSVPTPTTNVFIPIVDENEANNSNKNKKITFDTLVAAIPIPAGGMSLNEKINQNILFENVARLNYQDSLESIAYKGGTFDIFSDETKIATKTQVSVSTLAVGADNGSVKIAGGSNLTGTSYDSVSFSVSSQATNPQSVVFNDDGTKFFVANGASGADAIYQYSVSTPFTLTGASYDSVSLSTQSQTNSNIKSIFLGDSGTKLYAITINGNTVYQYTLPTAGTLASASYASKSFSVNSQDTFAWGLSFNNNGTKMYITGNTTNDIFQYTLSTGWDVSTASYDSVSFAFSEAGIKTIVFNDDGSKLFALSVTSDIIYQYSLSTGFVVSSLSYDSISFDFNSQDTTSLGFFIKQDKLFMSGSTNDSIFQYTIGFTFPTTGNFISTSLDLTSDLAANPTKVVVSSTFATPTDTNLSLKISDGTPENDVTITSANFDTEVDCSSLTTRTLTLQWLFTTSDTAVTPTLNNYGVYFT